MQSQVLRNTGGAALRVSSRRNTRSTTNRVPAGSNATPATPAPSRRRRNETNNTVSTPGAPNDANLQAQLTRISEERQIALEAAEATIAQLQLDLAMLQSQTVPPPAVIPTGGSITSTATSHTIQYKEMEAIARHHIPDYAEPQTPLDTMVGLARLEDIVKGQHKGQTVLLRFLTQRMFPTHFRHLESVLESHSLTSESAPWETALLAIKNALIPESTRASILADIHFNFKGSKKSMNTASSILFTLAKSLPASNQTAFFTTGLMKALHQANTLTKSTEWKCFMQRFTEKLLNIQSVTTHPPDLSSVYRQVQEAFSANNALGDQVTYMTHQPIPQDMIVGPSSLIGAMDGFLTHGNEATPTTSLQSRQGEKRKREEMETIAAVETETETQPTSDRLCSRCGDTRHFIKQCTLTKDEAHCDKHGNACGHTNRVCFVQHPELRQILFPRSTGGKKDSGSPAKRVRTDKTAETTVVLNKDGTVTKIPSYIMREAQEARTKAHLLAVATELISKGVEASGDADDI